MTLHCTSGVLVNIRIYSEIKMLNCSISASALKIFRFRGRNACPGPRCLGCQRGCRESEDWGHSDIPPCGKSSFSWQGFGQTYQLILSPCGKNRGHGEHGHMNVDANMYCVDKMFSKRCETIKKILILTITIANKNLTILTIRWVASSGRWTTTSWWWKTSTTTAQGPTPSSGYLSHHHWQLNGTWAR